jgi:hypothetical protein
MRFTNMMYFILSAALIGSITCGKRMPSEYKEFFALPLSQQLEQFRTYPVSKQLDLYLYDWNYIHPAKVGFAYTIAERGETVAPFLVDRLILERNEHSQDAIIHIFEVMYERGLLRTGNHVVQTIRHVVANMKNSDIQQLSNERLLKIEGRLASKCFGKVSRNNRT